MRPAALIYNPKSGKWLAERQLSEILALLQRAGWTAEPRPTRGPGDATPLAAEAVRGGAEVVFAIGGDGTLREVAKGLLGSSAILGPLPSGTANVLSYELGIPRHPLRAAAAMMNARPREIDVGKCNDEPFLMMASAGLDAEVMATQNSAMKRRFGPAAIAWSGFQRAFTYAYPDIEVHTDSGESLCGSFVVVANISRYGGPFQIAPAARPDDGALDLVVFQGRGPLATAALAGGVLTRRVARNKRVQTRRVRQVELRFDPPTRLQIDGDPLEPVAKGQIGLAEQRLRILSLI